MKTHMVLDRPLYIKTSQKEFDAWKEFADKHGYNMQTLIRRSMAAVVGCDALYEAANEDMQQQSAAKVHLMLDARLDNAEKRRKSG